MAQLKNTDRQIIEAHLKTSTGVAGKFCKVDSQLKLGVFYYDCANWEAAGGPADGEHICDILGVRVVRDADLAVGKFVYDDIYGTEIATNV